MEEVSVKCAVLKCNNIIKSGDTYYLLGGKIVTCTTCAESDAPLDRQWHNIDPYILNTIKKIM
jgi:hypothetical protein